jgi:hypothetical protein
MLLEGFSLAKLRHWPRALDVGLAEYNTTLVQWCVVHSHERRLAGSMIDDEFEVHVNFSFYPPVSN